MTDVSKQAGAGRTTFLTEPQKQQIYDTALGILADIGMKVHHDEGEAVMLAGGCHARRRRPRARAGRDRARRRARPCRRASRSTTAKASRPWRSAAATPTTATAPTSCTSSTWRPASAASPRSPTSRVAARLCDALPDIDFVMSGAYPDGMEAQEAYPRQFRAMIKATTKPLVMTAGGVETVEPMWRMACEVRGGADALRAKPYFVMYNQPVSPLKHPFETVDKLLFCADRGIPSTYCPRRSPAARRPSRRRARSRWAWPRRSSASSCTSSARPGAPFVIGQGPNVLDMATAQSMYNSPEFVRAYACEVEMAKWLDLPNWGFSGHTDAQVIDAQAGMEADELTKLSMQLGSNLNHDVGYLDFGLTGSLEEIVMVAEFIARDRRLLAEHRGLARDAGRRRAGQGRARRRLSGPAPHLAPPARRASGGRALLNRMSHDRWLETGGLDLTEQGARKAREIVATHRGAARCPTGLVARIDAVDRRAVRRRRREPSVRRVVRRGVPQARRARAAGDERARHARLRRRDRRLARADLSPPQLAVLDRARLRPPGVARGPAAPRRDQLVRGAARRGRAAVAADDIDDRVARALRDRRSRALRGMPDVIARLAGRHRVPIVTSNRSDIVEAFLAQLAASPACARCSAATRASKVPKIRRRGGPRPRGGGDLVRGRHRGRHRRRPRGRRGPPSPPPGAGTRRAPRPRPARPPGRHARRPARPAHA